MLDPLQPFLESNRFAILDGALATELEHRGADLRDPLWSGKVLLDQPDLIRQVHLDYLSAGADVITTASYQLTFDALRNRGLSTREASEVFTQSVRIAQEARDAFLADRVSSQPRPLIAASLGPYGAALGGGAEYHGNYGLSKADLIAFHRPRAAILAAAGPDILACETIPSLLEAEAIVELLQEFPNTPAWLAFTCRDDCHVAHGEPFAEAIALANQSPNVAAAGVNCTHPKFVSNLLGSVRNVAQKPLLAYPNSGESWDSARKCWKVAGTDPDFSGWAPQWFAEGARLIGGCCRTTPHTIRGLSQWRDENVSRNSLPGRLES